MVASHFVLFGALTTWLTPLWMLGVGVTAGLLGLLLILGITWLISRPTAAWIWRVLHEGTMQYVFYFALFIAAFTVVAGVQMPVDRVVQSLMRIPSAQEIEREIVIPPLTEDHEVDVSFRGEELQSYSIGSTQDLRIATEVDGQRKEISSIKVQGGETTRWQKVPGEALPLAGYVSKLYFTNYSRSPAQLELQLDIDVEYPQVYSVPPLALGVVGLFAVYYLLHLLFPKLSAIADVTSKHAVSQPIYLLALGIGAFCLIFFILLPYNTFGEDVKMLQLTGMTLIMILSIVVALWTASISVADEIDGKTALTLLSKPISRRDFILGKFLGIVWPVLLLFLVLGALYLLTVSYKVVYDAREGSQQAPTWQACFTEVVQVIPGLMLAFMEAVVLTAISVAISTRLPMLANLVICFSVYAVGHLAPTLVEAAPDFEVVRFVGQLTGVVFPILKWFNVDAAIVGGTPVPFTYVATVGAYCLLYCTIAMLLALFLFEDRDLA